MQISAGKLWSMRRLADTGGHFKMTAVDQRPPIMNLIKEKKGVDEASFEDVAAVKAALARNLAPESSAVLLDPIWAYTDCVGHVLPSQGLLLTIEDHEFEDTPGGRKSFEIADWTVAKIKRAGADGVKALAWYRPDASAEVNAHQQAFVERLGQACEKHDICFLLELLVYPLPGDATQTTEYVEHADKHPQLVLDSLRVFADPKYKVDLFKMESPVAAADVPDPESPAAAECQKWFDEMGRITDRPWVMLSAGADMETFRRILVYAYRAGASGYLAGRAIWLQASQLFPDLASMDQALKGDAIAYMREINELTDRMAKPWQENQVFADGIDLAGGGEKFPANYVEASVK